MTQTAPTRREVIAGFVPTSPLVGHLGMRLDALWPDRAELVLPFRDELATIGDVVHGGAIASLVDTAGMVAAWSDDEVPDSLNGSTISMSIEFVSAARATDLRATATVIRRGRTLCFCEVTVTDAEDRVVAKGLMTHRYG